MVWNTDQLNIYACETSIAQEAILYTGYARK